MTGMTGMTDTVASPCVSVCNMDAATGWCVGCLRTLDEIACWSVLHDDDKLAVLAELQQRRVEWDDRDAARSVSQPETN